MRGKESEEVREDEGREEKREGDKCIIIQGSLKKRKFRSVQHGTVRYLL